MPLLKDYFDAPWLTRQQGEPSPEAKKRIPEIFAEQAPYPMAPGNELTYLDDRTPDTMTREDVNAPHGLHLYVYTPKTPKQGDRRGIYYVHGGGVFWGGGGGVYMKHVFSG